MGENGRSLCEKYTALEGEELDIIESYINRLEDISRTENCDVFIDCPTITGNSLIIVGEKKPFEAESLYSTHLLGSFIKWENEPAVKRAYNSALPVTNLIAVSMPENRNVMQSAFPIIYREKVLGVLIYEKLAPVVKNEDEIEVLLRSRFLSDAEEKRLLEALDEAVFYIKWNDHICFRNHAAKSLLRDIGYVDDPLNMHVTNFWHSYNKLGESRRTAVIAGHFLEGRYIYIGSEKVKCILLIKNITKGERAIKEKEGISLAYSGYRHRVKNILQLVKGLYSQKAAKTGEENLKIAYEEMAERLSSLQIGLTRRNSENGRMELKPMLRDICEEMIKNECGENYSVSLEVEGSDSYTSDENAVLICEIITELMHNSLKYAFKGRQHGKIRVTVSEQLLGKSILFEDDGIGFLPEDIKKESTGLQILESIVRDRLSGDFSIESGKTGTKTKIEYIE